MRFDFDISKSPTIHVTDETLKLLEELRQKMVTDKDKHKCYDDVIQFALRYLNRSKR